MDQATKDKLKAAGLDGVITAFEALQTTATKAAEDLVKAQQTIKEKDILIEQKTQDVVGARQQYKKLADMTDTEKAEMSAKEIELQQRQEQFEVDQKKFQDDQKAFTEKEVTARRERAIVKIAGKDPELQQKVRDAFTKIVDHDKAQTEEEIASLATTAFNMLGVPRPEPVRDVMNGSGGAPTNESEGGSFAEQAAGKELAKAMNLPVEAPKTDGAK